MIYLFIIYLFLFINFFIHLSIYLLFIYLFNYLFIYSFIYLFIIFYLLKLIHSVSFVIIIHHSSFIFCFRNWILKLNKCAYFELSLSEIFLKVPVVLDIKCVHLLLSSLMNMLIYLNRFLWYSPDFQIVRRLLLRYEFV